MICNNEYVMYVHAIINIQSTKTITTQIYRAHCMHVKPLIPTLITDASKIQ